MKEECRISSFFAFVGESKVKEPTAVRFKFVSFVSRRKILNGTYEIRECYLRHAITRFFDRNAET